MDSWNIQNTFSFIYSENGSERLFLSVNNNFWVVVAQIGHFGFGIMKLGMAKRQTLMALSASLDRDFQQVGAGKLPA